MASTLGRHFGLFYHLRIRNDDRRARAASTGVKTPTGGRSDAETCQKSLVSNCVELKKLRVSFLISGSSVDLDFKKLNQQCHFSCEKVFFDCHVSV